MATHGDIGLSQPAASTITMKLRTVTMDMNSTVTHQEVLTLGGAESSLEVARVQATAPASTSMGLVVRIAGGPSSAADLLARVNQGVANSSAGDFWNVKAHSSVQTGWSQFAASTAGQSTNTPVLSSAATVPYVSAFIATSTMAGPTVFAFTAGSTVLWPFTLWADGGVPTVSQVAGQPGFIFKGQADRPLEFRILSGSTGTVYLGVTYKQE